MTAKEFSSSAQGVFMKMCLKVKFRKKDGIVDFQSCYPGLEVCNSGGKENAETTEYVARPIHLSICPALLWNNWILDLGSSGKGEKAR
jgi:hypothetical protein